MIASPEVRRAREIIRADAKAKRKARPAKVRPTAEGQRKPRERDPGFLAFLRRQPCAVAGPGCDGAVQAAHLRTHAPGERPTGMGRKPDDSRCLPLCAEHHRQQHATNELRFWAVAGIDPFQLAAELYRRYLEQAA